MSIGRLKIVLLIVALLPFANVFAQRDSAAFKNRICSGVGAEDGYLGVDYSRAILKSTLFAGAGLGFGTGLTGYFKYEPVHWHGLSPFISAGASYSIGGTLVLSPGTSMFSSSGGIEYLFQKKWPVVPMLAIGLSYFSPIHSDNEDAMGGLFPLLKFGMAFPGKF
jgi:hypothetical protein